MIPVQHPINKTKFHRYIIHFVQQSPKCLYTQKFELSALTDLKTSQTSKFKHDISFLENFIFDSNKFQKDLNDRNLKLIFTKKQVFIAVHQCLLPEGNQFPSPTFWSLNGDFMQRRFTERCINANVELCFVIGQCHGNGALFDVGVGATCASNVVCTQSPQYGATFNDGTTS